MTEGGLFIPIDLTTVTNDFEPLPEGVYVVQVEKVEPAKSKAGHNMVAITMNVVEPVEFMGRKGFTNISLQPKALWKLKEFVEACGVPYDGGGVNLELARGVQCLVKVMQEQYTANDGSIKIRNSFESFMVKP